MFDKIPSKSVIEVLETFELLSTSPLLKLVRHHCTTLPCSVYVQNDDERGLELWYNYFIAGPDSRPDLLGM